MFYYIFQLFAPKKYLQLYCILILGNWFLGYPIGILSQQTVGFQPVNHEVCVYVCRMRHVAHNAGHVLQG